MKFSRMVAAIGFGIVSGCSDNRAISGGKVAQLLDIKGSILKMLR
jgi:hypothetical protein